MSTRYVHTNIVAQDWQRLVRFYVDVFGCKENPPERDHFGTWIDRLTGIEDAHIRGMHLSLPGFGPGAQRLRYFNTETTTRIPKSESTPKALPT